MLQNPRVASMLTPFHHAAAMQAAALHHAAASQNNSSPIPATPSETTSSTPHCGTCWQTLHRANRVQQL